MFRFQEFPVYNKTRSFVKEVYLLANTLPQNEQYALASQLRRASSSILLNIAEGSMRKSDPEMHHFLMISLGSVGETAAIFDLCLDNNYISSSNHEQFMLKCEDIAKQLTAFSKSLQRK